jgi:hypothetical protein
MALLTDIDVRNARWAVGQFDKDIAANPSLGVNVYGSDDAMLRQYLNDSGFAGISETEARALAHRVRQED